MHWTRWRNLCKPKQLGGMGFQSLSDFNRALLAKQVWRIIRDPTSLLAKVLKARYFKHTDIMEAELGSNPSYIWRSILWSRSLIQRVGDGNRIYALSDSWIPSLASGRSSSCVMHSTILVKDLISSSQAW